MSRYLYVGLARSESNGRVYPVSVARTKRRAGELLDEWFATDGDGFRNLGVEALLDNFDLGEGDRPSAPTIKSDVRALGLTPEAYQRMYGGDRNGD